MPTPVPGADLPPPEQPTVTVGYSDSSFVGRIALALADARGYFTDAGFQNVTFTDVEAPLPGLLNGSLDLAILDTAEAATGYGLGLPVQGVAGHRIGTPAAVPTAADPALSVHDLLATTTDMIVDRPATVTAFTAAYVRALHDLRTLHDAGSIAPGLSAGDDDLFRSAETAGIEVPAELMAAWPDPLAGFSPDGGFGALADGGGLGDLRSFLAGDAEALDGLDEFLWTDGLHAAQRWLGLPQNPLPAPDLTRITIGHEASDLGSQAPFIWATGQDYFRRWGLDEVQFVEMDDPVQAVIDGQVTMAIADTISAGVAVEGGAPIQAIAGYRNHEADGQAYGGDMLVTHTDLLADHPATVVAVLGAYVQSLQDLRDPATTDELFSLATAAGVEITSDDRSGWPVALMRFGPFDGGVGSVDVGGGLGELRDYLEANLDPAPGAETLVDATSVHRVQAAMGLSLNPVAP